MRRTTSLFLLGLLATGGCGSVTAPIPPALLGEWAAEPSTSPPRISSWTTLAFRADGRFTLEIRTAGLHAGGEGSIDAVTRIDARFEATGERIRLRDSRQTDWDRLLRPVAVETRGSGGTFVDGARYEVAGDLLRLYYSAASGGRPAPAEAVFRRVP
jgi:hypothetical protein